MPYLELSLRCSESDQPRYENALEDVGALAVTLLDADADTGNEQAILEPGVGQTPLWHALVLTALFPAETNALALLAALESFDPGLDWTTAGFRTVDDQDWERAWMDQYVPLRFGARTFIVPWNHELPAEADHAEAAVVRLDPGLAFGSGTHPTTALVPALAGPVGRRREIDWRDRARLRLRLRHPRLGRAQAGRIEGRRRRQRSAGPDRDLRQCRAQRRRRAARRLPAAGRTGRHLSGRGRQHPRLGAGCTWPKPSPRASRRAAASRCPGSCTDRKTNCWPVIPNGSSSWSPPGTATGCASMAAPQRLSRCPLHAMRRGMLE